MASDVDWRSSVANGKLLTSSSACARSVRASRPSTTRPSSSAARRRWLGARPSAGTRAAWSSGRARSVGNCFLRKEDQDAALKQRYPGVTFDFVNGGVPGYTVASSRQNLRHKVAPLEPDVIVVYHATNDLSAEVNALAAAAGLGRAHQQPGWLERHSLLWELVSKNLRVMAARVAAALAGDARVQELIRQRGR